MASTPRPSLPSVKRAGIPDELLAVLETAGRFSDLLRALRIHAELRPADASLLYQQAGNVAEQQLDDRPGRQRNDGEPPRSPPAPATTPAPTSPSRPPILWFRRAPLARVRLNWIEPMPLSVGPIARGDTAICRALSSCWLIWPMPARDPEAAMFLLPSGAARRPGAVTMRATVYLPRRAVASARGRPWRGTVAGQRRGNRRRRQCLAPPVIYLPAGAICSADRWRLWPGRSPCRKRSSSPAIRYRGLSTRPCAVPHR